MFVNIFAFAHVWGYSVWGCVCVCVLRAPKMITFEVPTIDKITLFALLGFFLKICHQILVYFLSSFRTMYFNCPQFNCLVIVSGVHSRSLYFKGKKRILE